MAKAKIITHGNDSPAIRQLDMVAKLMDAQFKVPGTEVRFGLDAVIGLIPGLGDLSTFAISGYMLIVMSQNGASGFVMARMLLNVLIDTVFGMIPLIGDLFDVAFKSNMRNIRLMREHYVEGRHRGGAWKVVLPFLILLVIIIGGSLWLLYKFFEWIF
ncbi:MAG: DUF4112 domain-containing protein [Bacteroidota bacterium]|nr:DUF4112 domain-containing protein [Ferruginibacter sp.]